MTSVSGPEPLVEECGPNGLPVVSDEHRQNLGNKSAKMIAGILIASRLIGLGIAYAIFWGAGDSVTARLTMLREMDLGYLYLAFWCFSVLVHYLNMYPGYFKAQLNIKGNIRANMAFFKVLGNGDQGPVQPYIGYEDEGTVGEYNRANRSLSHFGEYMGSSIVCIAGAGVVLPRPTFVLTLIFVLGRIVHQIGYTKGYGSHALGFGLATTSNLTLEGMLLLSAFHLISGA